tara:strand:+ start:1248 stop:1790 length:543 start_codon:yes stop_codon:yes gene_type:complete
MACNVTAGRLLPCKSAFGGVKAVYFATFPVEATIEISDAATLNEVTGFTGSPVWFKYDTKGNSSLETTITSSRENGTTFYTQTLNLTLTYLDNLTKNQVQLIVAGRPVVVVEDYYGHLFLCGYENGMDASGGTIVTGTAAGDLSGFTLVMEGMEETAPYFVQSTAGITAAASPINPTPAA